MARTRFVSLVDELIRQRPELGADDARAAIAAGRVRVDGRVLQNVNANVRRGCSVVVVADRPLRGQEKLGHFLDRFAVPVAGRTVLDVGAAAGGFTTALLDRGAARVYAVDVGHGQLVGSLRQDERVVNLEATNVAALGVDYLPDAIEGVSIDVSYLSLTEAVACLRQVPFAADCWLAGLVKPMFELGRADLPTSADDFDEAVRLARAGVEAAGWELQETAESAVRGANGAVEFFVLARRRRASTATAG